MKKIIICLLLFLFFSCKKEDITGVYVANHKEGADTLIIFHNNTYRHLFVANNGVKYVQEGTWENDIESERIDLKNYDWHLKGYGLIQKDTTFTNFWSVEVGYDLWGNPLIYIDEDRNIKYTFESDINK